MEQFSPSFESPAISVKPGYIYDGQLGRTVVVTIPKASPNHTGSYFCQLIPAVNVSFSLQPPRPCVFTLKGESSSVHSFSLMERGRGKVRGDGGGEGESVRKREREGGGEERE